VREWRIFNRLSSLAVRGLCFNFVQMADFYVERARQEDGSARYVDFVLEFADARLDEATKRGLSLIEFKEVAFQLVWALHIAQREMQFVHWDLHARNVLLQRPQGGAVCSFADQASDTTWYASHWIVKITDFGLSRILLEDDKTVVYNPKQGLSEVFTPGVDIEKVMQNLDGIKTSDLADCEKKLRREFRRELARASRPPFDLLRVLRHPFFKDLQTRPADLDARPKMAASLQGSSTEARGDDDDVGSLQAQFEKLSVSDEKKEEGAAPKPTMTESKKENRRRVAVQKP
jgi:hypothetical protein